MSSDAAQSQEQRSLLAKCIEGDRESLGILRARHHESLFKVLLSRGASQTQADDLLADLWGDCVGNGVDHPSLLEKYSGRCALQSWLITVATHRLIDLQRRLSKRKDVAADAPYDATSFFHRIPDPGSTNSDAATIRLLRESLEAAFNACPAEGLLMLRLVFQHGLTQRQLAQMWRCHEATISRSLNQALALLQRTTLQELKKRDPWLELTWQDLLDLCETQQVGFL